MSGVYRFKKDRTGKVFSFTSVGIKKLKKVVTFKSYDVDYYNIVLQTELKGILLPDTEISNNGDARKVLATTSAIIDYFFIHHPKATLHIAGSTIQRTQIYHQLLTAELKVRNKYILLGIREARNEDGSVKEVVEEFASHEKYIAFLLFRRF